jgi:hypothetical protein
MRCRHILQRLLRDDMRKLSAEQQAEVRQHLAQCATCRNEWEAIQRAEHALQRWVADVPVAGVEAVQARLLQPRTRRHVRWRRAAQAVSQPLFLTIRAATLLLVGAVLLVSLSAMLGLPQARTLIQRALVPLGVNAPTLPVLPMAGDQLWIEGVNLAPGSQLAGRTTLEVQVGYTLASASNGVISVRLASNSDTPQRYFVEPVAILGGTGVVTLRAELEPARVAQVLGAGPAHLEVTLRDWQRPGNARLLSVRNFREWWVVVP